jgi:hypothetical protein
MSIFSSILNGIFGHAQATASPAAAPSAKPVSAQPGTAAQAPSPGGGMKIPYARVPAPAAPSTVDVEAVLDDLLAQKKLNSTGDTRSSTS